MTGSRHPRLLRIGAAFFLVVLVSGVAYSLVHAIVR
jgi:hypothetical protein